MKRPGAAVLAGLLLCLCGLPAIGASEEHPVLAAYRAHCRRIRSIEFKATGTKTLNDQLRETYTYSSRMEMVPDYPSQVGRYHLESRDDMVGPPAATFTRAMAFDGLVTRILDTTGSGERKSCGAHIERGNYPNVEDQWLSAYYPNGFISLDDLFKDVVVTGPIDWKGKLVYAVSAYYNAKPKDGRRDMLIYLDPEHDYSVSYTEWTKADGSKVCTAEPGDFVQKDGIWLPSTTTISGYFAPGLVKDTCRFDYVKVNPVFAPGDFTMVFPPGTHVDDKVEGIRYRVPTLDESDLAKQLGPETLAPQEQVAESTDGVMDTGSAPGIIAGKTSARAPLSVGQWLTLFGVCAAAALLAVFLLRALRAKRKAQTEGGKAEGKD